MVNIIKDNPKNMFVEEISNYMEMISKFHELDVYEIEVVDGNIKLVNDPEYWEYTDYTIISWYLNNYRRHDFNIPFDEEIMSYDGDRLVIHPWKKHDKWRSHWNKVICSIMENKLIGDIIKQWWEEQKQEQ